MFTEQLADTPIVPTTVQTDIMTMDNVPVILRDEETKRDPSTVRRGDFVDYVLPTGSNKGQLRTAIVCRVWTKGNPVVQLVVFTDGLNDLTGQNGSNGTFWATSVRYAEPVEGEAMEINTWHWPTGEM